MKITNQEIETARQWDNLYAQVMRELRKHNPDRQRIKSLSRDAKKVSTRLRRLMGW